MLQRAQELRRTQGTQRKSLCLSERRGPVTYQRYRLHKPDPDGLQRTNKQDLHQYQHQTTRDRFLQPC